MGTRFRRAAPLVLLLAAAARPATRTRAGSGSPLPPLPPPARRSPRRSGSARSAPTSRRPGRRSAARRATCRPPRGTRSCTCPRAAAGPSTFPPREDRARIEAELRAELGEADFATIELRPLPAAARPSCASTACCTCPTPTWSPAAASTRCTAGTATSSCSGCCATARCSAARDMVDNFLYEIEHYGTLLNANRTYYLTPLAAAVPDPDDPRRSSRRRSDRAWLERALPAGGEYYRFWTTRAPPRPGDGPVALLRLRARGRRPRC